MSACTPFFYAAIPTTIVALIPDADGVRMTAQQQLSDDAWRDLCDLRFTWTQFAEFAQDAAEIAADPQAALARIRDLPDFEGNVPSASCDAVT